jgi:molybdopterin synthase sulfur carrier subunit
MATVRLFAAARQAAGTGSTEVEAGTVDEVIEAISERYGSGLVSVLETCRVWVNGEAAEGTTRVGPSDEVAILPPVSGGCDG